ncbi:MOSC domain-containing protein [Microlunatus soli]|uniref:MOSC domain-containing protein n=1 Tax=Microlunatus soli TaxID=630515 RepID=UPI0012FB80F3|nr:MOSC domain-containing protein [Microlunatus soli]
MPTDHTVTRLSTTPVKGLSLHHPDAIRLTARGVVGDRQFLLIDDNGKLQSCTRNQALYGLTAHWQQQSRRLSIRRGADELLTGVIEPGSAADTDMWGLRTLPADEVADPIWHTFFSDLIGRPVRLLQAREPAVDVQPATLLGTGSVQELARQAGLASIDPGRFRMLIEFSGGVPHVEDSWNGLRLQIGDAVLRAGGGVKRCAATTRNVDSGEVDLQTLRVITGYRGRQDSVLGPGALFGIYAAVLQPGTISVGDELIVDADG